MNTVAAPRARSWVWFWALLVTLALAGVIIPIIYNLGLQLKPEQLAEARAKWQAQGIRDYDLAYQERLDNETDGIGYRIQVRNGKVVSAVREGEPIPPADWDKHTVEALFERINVDLRADAESTQRRNYVSAFFDKNNGCPIRYVRRIRGTKQRLEWNARLTPVPPDTPADPARP